MSRHEHIEGTGPLEELALDMIWSWNRAADKIWQEIDPELWEETLNPWVVLQTVSRQRLKELLAKPDFRKSVDDLVKAKQTHVQSKGWFRKTYPHSPLTCVAFFSMEFMLSEALPIYSGGLGNVAGDGLKGASNLDVPVVAIGLLYQQGYFRQLIDSDGSQKALYPYNDPGQLPIMPLRKADGEWLRIEIKCPGWSLWLRAWEAKVGRTRLFLLDSNDPSNAAIHRGVTGELYGGDSELRLKQEIALGIGGWRLLKAIGLKPEICHLNEGHAAFAVLERAGTFMKENGVPFDVALAATRAGNLFTTHTAVPAGFDRFSPELIERYFKCYSAETLALSLDDFLALGRQDRNNSDEFFNMAYLALRGSGAVNGVSRLHGCVSRAIFSPLFARWPESEVPIGFVTNGVHTPSWDSAMADEIWTHSCGKARWLDEMETIEEDFRKVPDEKLWKMRSDARQAMIEYGRKRIAKIWATRGMPQEEIDRAKQMFNPNTLTIGFARRFATYKRPNMLLHDPERLIRILTNPERPVQLILAGKAHPADMPGQAMIQQWIQFIRRPEVRAHVIFLPDYDVLMAEKMVQGIDVWINTPRRPWEACGTSGMKVLVNGGINVSELDGWWAEAYSPEVGWAIGDGKEHGDDPSWDAAEADALYGLLENEIVPEFYNRQNGIPKNWINRVRESMARLTPRFSSNRAIREYTEQYYLPLATAYHARAENKGALAKTIATWQRDLGEKWDKINIVDYRNENGNVEAQIFLGDIPPSHVKVELYAIPKNGESSTLELKRDSEPREMNIFVYRAQIPGKRAASDFTLRVIPFSEHASVPLEAPYIWWQR